MIPVNEVERWRVVEAARPVVDFEYNPEEGYYDVLAVTWLALGKMWAEHPLGYIAEDGEIVRDWDDIYYRRIFDEEFGICYHRQTPAKRRANRARKAEKRVRAQKLAEYRVELVRCYELQEVVLEKYPHFQNDWFFSDLSIAQLEYYANR